MIFLEFKISLLDDPYGPSILMFNFSKLPSFKFAIVLSYTFSDQAPLALTFKKAVLLFVDAIKLKGNH